MSDPPSNCVIVLTPPGAAAIAVLRFVGNDAVRFLQSRLTRISDATPATLKPGRSLHLHLHDGAEILDDPIVFFSQDGTFADVSIHGSPWLVQCVLDLAGRAGLEIVRPALSPDRPLPLSAVDGESILEREVNAALPLARTDRTVRMLLHQRAAWQALKAADPSDQVAQCAAILSDRTLYHALAPPKVAIIGIPNAGKSTLANALFQRERTITADLPGTTRDWVADIAHIDGLPITLIDTPGLRDTADPIESQAITNSAATIAGADLVLLLLDNSQPLTGHQSRLLHDHPAAMPVINKSDLPAAWSNDIVEFSQGPIPIVATTGRGLPELRQRIRSFLRCDTRPPVAPRFWTARQEELLIRARTDPSRLAEI